jgi:RND family efflux transporter MFP subunit
MQLTSLTRLRFTSYIAILPLFFALAAVGCGGGDAPPGAGGPPGGMPPSAVELLTITPHPIEQASEFVGTVKSRQSTNVQAQAEGFITRIHVKSGDRVSAGTPMLEIDSTSQQALVANLESVRSAREADVTLARQRAQRAKALLSAGAGSQQEVEAADAALASAEAQIRALDQQIKQQKNELGYYRVTAPSAGIVGDIPVRQGDRVTRQTLLTTLDSNTGLEIYVNVPVQQASKLKVGLPLQVVSDSDASASGEKITFVSPSVDDLTQTVLVKAAVTRTTGLRTDQFVRARIVWSTDPGITVPITAVLRISGQYFVYVAVAGRGGQGLAAQQRQVTLGPVIGNDYILLGGVKDGERVVVGGIQKIGDGAPIQEMPAGAGPGRAGGK